MGSGISKDSKGWERNTAKHYLRRVTNGFETLNPEGVWFSHIQGINDKETADRVIQRITAWR